MMIILRGMGSCSVMIVGRGSTLAAVGGSAGSISVSAAGTAGAAASPAAAGTAGAAGAAASPAAAIARTASGPAVHGRRCKQQNICHKQDKHRGKFDVCLHLLSLTMTIFFRILQRSADNYYIRFCLIMPSFIVRHRITFFQVFPDVPVV